MTNNDALRNKTLTGLAWTFMERTGTRVVSFVISIILARILMPEDYGVIAIVLVFVNICDVFVHGGMGMALVQSSNTDERDYSSVFWISLCMSFILYGILYVVAPMISRFFTMPILIPVLRVLGLRLPLSAFNTVQRAIVSRSMQFKTFFYASLIGILVAAMVGISMAYMGYGIWALVGQQLAGTVVSTITISYSIKWMPKFIFCAEKARKLFSFGWKLLVGSLIDVFYDNFRSIYVGKLYTPADLAFYTRGDQFPSIIIKNINGSISTVLFPALSRKQDDIDAVRNIVRKAIKTCSFIITPLLFGLIVIAKPLVLILLTEKWLPCVVFIQILCLAAVLQPIQTSNLQAIYSLGRSDIGLKLNIIKKSFGFIIILITALHSVECMAWGAVVSAVFASIMNTFPNKKLLDYGYFQQMKDILPFILLSCVMAVFVHVIGTLPIENLYIQLFLQITLGITFYYGIAYLLNMESLRYIMSVLFTFHKII